VRIHGTRDHRQDPIGFGQAAGYLVRAQVQHEPVPRLPARLYLLRHRSECYGIDDLSDVAVKVNALELLQDELPRKRIKGTIGFGSMNDCYQPLEAGLQMTRRALEIIAGHGFPVHILTKSDLVLRDLDCCSASAGSMRGELYGDHGR